MAYFNSKRTMLIGLKGDKGDTGEVSAAELAAEETARENADTVLQDNITAEQTARENADTNLQNQINNKISNATLLWSNSNIGYGFNAQTITINNASAYDYLLIEFRQFSQITARYVQIFRNYNNATNAINFSEVDLNNSRFVARSRTFTKNSDTSITWGNGLTWYSNSGIDTNNQYIEPTAIYGINLGD